MNSQLSARDWEYLSAYLDRQLKPKEMASLEARLSVDPVLSAALGELQRTRDALRSLPKLRAPRNFTLTPQMVGQRSPLRARPAARLAPVFGFASALATFLLVLVIAGDFLGLLAPADKPVSQVPVVTAEVAAAPAALPSAEESTAKEASAAESIPLDTAVTEDAALLVAAQPAAGMTVTAEMPLAAETAPFVAPEATPLPDEMMTMAMTETMIVAEAMTETISAKHAAGMGGGMGGGAEAALGPDLPLESAILTSEGFMWNAVISVATSPTETLMFPLTVTMVGPGITMTFAADSGADGLLDEDVIVAPEPTPTAVPETFLTETEAAAMAEEASEPAGSTESEQPAEQAETNAQATFVQTETPAPQRELAAPAQEAAATQDLVPALPTPQPARTSHPSVRIVEIALALLALITGLAALYAWWVRRG